MSNVNKEIKKKFDVFFVEWEKIVESLKTQVSSSIKLKSYVDNEPYQEIVKLGKDALPLIIEKLEQGVSLLNNAFLDITGVEMDEVFGKERDALNIPKFRLLSESEKSALIIEWWQSKQQ